MTTASFETSLYQQLSPFFAVNAFALIREKKQFRQTTGNGFLNVILSSVFHRDTTALEVSFGCRNEQVEQIAQQFLNTSPDLRADANTLLVSIGRFSNAQYVRHKIQSEAELSEVCHQIAQFFDTRGFEFLRRSVTLPYLDETLNQSPETPCSYVYNQTHRCYKGLIAARLNHNPDFATLVDQYRQQLTHHTQNPYERGYFERLVAYLYHYSAN